MALVIVALLGMNVWQLITDRAQELRNAAVQADNVASRSAAQMRNVLTEAGRVLALVRLGLRHTGLQNTVLGPLEDLMRHHVATSPLISGLYIHDRSGNLIASSSERPLRFNNANQPYFVHHRLHPEVRARVDVPLVGPASGEWVIPISIRLEGPDGDFAGVAIITVSIEQVRVLFTSLEQAADAESLIAFSDRIVIYQPLGAKATGKPFLAGTWGDMKLRGDAGTFEAVSPLDGERRIYGFRQLSDFPLLVVVGVSKSTALEAWRGSAISQSTGIALLCVALWVSTVYRFHARTRRRRAEAGLRAVRDELERTNEQLARLAQYDSLMGIPNRRFFNERFHILFRQAQREQRSLAVVMVDVDYFKNYNDTYGHLQGDHCLKCVAEALQTVVLRPEDFVARYGGEELVLILPETNPDGAMRVAESARIAVEGMRLEHSASPFGYVTASFGVSAGVPIPSDTPEDLLRTADRSLYHAKSTGRNKVSAIADPLESRQKAASGTIEMPR